MLTAAQARLRLAHMLQPDVAPTLTTDEVDDLFRLAKRVDWAAVDPDDYADWTAGTAFSANAACVPTVRNGFLYTASAGTSGATEPVWPTTVGATVHDGGVVWTNAGSAPWTPTYDLYLAAAEGWRWKATKVVAQFDVKAGSVDAKRSQVYDAC